MIVAQLTARPGQSGKDIILLGLSAMNVEKLIEGKPIHVKPATHGGELINLPVEILICYGETEMDIKRALEPYFDKDTKVKVDPRL